MPLITDNPKRWSLHFFKNRGIVIPFFLTLTIALLVLYLLTLKSFNSIINLNSKQNDEYLLQTKINDASKFVTEMGVAENGFYTISTTTHLKNYPLYRDSCIALLNQLDTLTVQFKNIHAQIVLVAAYAQKRAAIIDKQYDLINNNRSGEAFIIKNKGRVGSIEC